MNLVTTTMSFLISAAVWMWSLQYRASGITHTDYSGKCKTTRQRFTVNKQKAILSGILMDCETQKPLKIGVMNVDGHIFNTDSSGTFHKLLEPGKHLVRAGWPTYQFDSLSTQLRSGDSLYVVFHLKADKRPLE